MEKGLIAGFPMINVKVTLTDGSYHPVDSSEMAFKVAAGQALKKAVPEAKPILLEPIYNVDVVIPEDYNWAMSWATSAAAAAVSSAWNTIATARASSS